MPRTSKKSEPIGQPAAAGQADNGPHQNGPRRGAHKAPSAKPAARTRKRSSKAAAEEETGRVEALSQRLGELSAQVEEMGRQACEVQAELQALRQQREQAARELEQTRQEAQAAQQEFLRLSVEAAERVRRDAGSIEGQAGEITQLFEQARGILQSLPRQADEARQHVAEVERRLPQAQQQVQAIEQSSRPVRQELERAQEDTLAIRRRLDALLAETTAAELRLVAARQGFEQAELQLLAIEQQLEQAAEQTLQAGEQAEEVRQEAGEVAAVVEEAAVAAEEAALAAAPEGRNRLGVTLEPGVVVDEVLPGSPAAEAGLVAGDVISAIDDTPLFTSLELRNRIHDAPADQEVSVRLSRAGQPLEVKARLGAAPAGEQAEGGNRLGVTVAPGVVVADALPGTPAERAGLARGDVLLSVNGTDVLTSEQFRQAVLPLPAHTEVVVQVRRGADVREFRTHLDEVV
jgi:PDZ domain-containing secreted protein